MDKEFDFSTAKRPHEVPALAKMREIRQKHLEQQADSSKPTNLIDDDVWQLIGQHANNAQDIAKMNSMLRVLFA